MSDCGCGRGADCPYPYGHTDVNGDVVEVGRQPVTPDREALVRAGAISMANVARLPEWMQIPALGCNMTPVAELVVDAVLPLLTDALDRARQQGRDEVLSEFRDAWERGMQKVASHVATRLTDPWDACRDVDPFTGQPDQHPCGDACEGACE